MTLMPPHRLLDAPLVLPADGVVVAVLDASFVLVLAATGVVVAVPDADEDEAASMI